MAVIREMMKLALIVIVIGLPPYLVALKVFEEDLSFNIKILLSIIYWAGAIYTQQVLPFILIIIILNKKYRSKDLSHEYSENESRSQFSFKDFLITSATTILIRFPIGIINIIYVFFLDSLGVKIQGQEVINIFVNSQNKLISLILMLLVVIVAPLNEEFSMRYWLFGKVLSPKVGIITGAIISSSLFTLLHYNIAGIPTFFILGLFACYIYYKKGLWGAVTVHFIFNLSSVIFLLMAKTLIPLA